MTPHFGIVAGDVQELLMFHEIVASTILVLLTLSVQCAGVATLIRWLRRIVTKELDKGSLFEAGLLVMQTTIAVILLHGTIILLWAGFFRCLCFRSWESALYFSGTSYSSVGYGDVLLPQQWRLLGPLESVVGVLMCGISVSLLFALMTRLIGGDTSLTQESTGSPHTRQMHTAPLRSIAGR